MKTTTFYLNIRRFNALLPLLAILLMALALAWGAFFSDTSPPPKSVIPPDRKESASSEVLDLSKLDVELDLGPKLVMLKVVIRKKSGSDYSRSAIRNLVFVEDDSTDLKWVFPTQQQELVSVHPLMNSNGVIKGIYVEAIDKENAVKSSEHEPRSIYVVPLDGAGYKKILSNVDEVISRRNDANKLRLIYQKDNTIRMAQVDMQDFLITGDHELAKMTELKK
ncbi:hypothetical protein [Limnohabitans sp. 2KL-51]|uniref:hypothetical protein n=1 Tax=Limnohabitans sp. 2KL-51 TaxID=1977911 RepID=UPI000D3A34AB|nr:hypothetical protein [Limnohabitans sp. 2KL-51]PUE50134.1 hypothetical protein B9Z49_05940 [Limnohabitans sp. 2KL-51]